nr:hypothetical protein [Tanacetum cinerariifolium]
GEEEVVGIVGPLYAFPLRVVIPFGLVMVLLGRVLETEDEAWKSQLAVEELGFNELELGNTGLGKSSQLAVEESRLDEPELGNLGIDKPVLDKLEAGFDHD